MISMTFTALLVFELVLKKKTMKYKTLINNGCGDVHGGSFDANSSSCRSASRGYNVARGIYDRWIGFRIVLKKL